MPVDPDFSSVIYPLKAEPDSSAIVTCWNFEAASIPPVLPAKPLRNFLRPIIFPIQRLRINAGGNEGGEDGARDNGGEPIDRDKGRIREVARRLRDEAGILQLPSGSEVEWGWEIDRWKGEI